MDSPKRERGFTLIEVMIGSAIALVMLSTLVTLANHVGASASRLNDRLVDRSAAGTLLERIQSDAGSAWAIWVPANDVLGDANGDGHELDFFAQDASHATHAWAYRFNSASQSVTRYAYAPSITPAPAESYAQISAFTATAFAPSDLANPASAFYDSLFATARVSEQRHDFGLFPNAFGGNDCFRVQIVAGGVLLDQAVAGATAPSHFTIVVRYTPPPAPVATPPPTPFSIDTFSPIPAPT